MENSYICSPNGALAEWLGAGLQNLSQWFDSATHLPKSPDSCLPGLLLSEYAIYGIVFAEKAHAPEHKNVLLQMKKILLLAVVGLMACFGLNAQPPMGGGGFPPMGGGGGFAGMNMASSNDTRTPEEKTEDVATKYGLDDTQRAALLELNRAYAGKLQMEVDTTMMQRDFRSMTEEERQAMFDDMQSRMGEMMDQYNEIAGNQDAYEDALKQIMTKKQYRKYRVDQEKEALKRQREMEQQFRNGGFGGGMPPMGGGGFGGPGGGFGGPGGRF